MIASLIAGSGTGAQPVTARTQGSDQPAVIAGGKDAGVSADPAPSHFQYRALHAALARETDPLRRGTLRLNLEHWRQMPTDLGTRYLLVNIPEAVVRLVVDDRVERVHKVIVGKPATPTPRFSASVTGVILIPSWTVPDSIIAESVGALVRTRPAAARAKGYAIGELRGWRIGLEQKPKNAKAFYGVIALGLSLGLLMLCVPIDPVKALFWSAVVNGVIAGPLMIVTMLVVCDPQRMGAFTAPRRLRIIGWLATAVMVAASIALFVF
jgi:hypothetical protein